MATRYPLVVDSSNYRIEEIPVGDVLDLTGVTVSGLNITAGIVTVGPDLLVGDDGKYFNVRYPYFWPGIDTKFVGVGTTGPGRKIDVHGDGRRGDQDVAIRIYSVADNGSGPSLILNNTGNAAGDNGGKSFALVSTGSSDGQGAGKFVIRDQTDGGTSDVLNGYNDYFTVVGGIGSVGIGTTSGGIVNALTIRGNKNDPTGGASGEHGCWIINDSPNGRAVLGVGTDYGDTAYGYLMYHGRGSQTTSGPTAYPAYSPRSVTLNNTDIGGLDLICTRTEDSASIRFYAGGGGSPTPRMIIKGSNGRVGIGSTLPSTNFDVTGGITCSGALSKGSGSFRIDHPLSAEKYLVHSFIEGPQADLIYRGTTTLAGGTATVNLDEKYGLIEGTWEALCRDPQVWVTSDDGWTLCKGSVSGATLTITAQDPTCAETVSWLVVAERQDDNIKDADWTDENGRPILEPLKA